MNQRDGYFALLYTKGIAPATLRPGRRDAEQFVPKPL